MLIAAIVIVAAFLTGVILTYRKSKKREEKFWDVSSRRLVGNFLIPLLAGGIFSFAMLLNDDVRYISSVTLLFYGLACVNASKYTLGDVRYLGLTIIIIGLFAAYFPGYGLLCWALGFGVCHIIYGALMYFKYDRK